jgi:hypothetical protein
MNNRQSSRSADESAAELIDIRRCYGHKYRVISEDLNSRNSDAWAWTIPAARGHLYLHSPDRLGAATNGRRVGRILARLSGVRIEQEADDGLNLSFPVEQFKAVARVMRPKRRRQISERERRRLTDVGRASRFAPKKGVIAGAQVDLSHPKPTNEPYGAPERPTPSRHDGRQMPREACE